MEFNPFRLCSGLKILGYFMILLVFGIIAVSYDAVVVLTWGPNLLDGGAISVLSALVLLLFHVLAAFGWTYSSDISRFLMNTVNTWYSKLVLLTWSYFMVLFRDPGAVPADWKVLPQQNLEDDNSAVSSISLAMENLGAMPSSSDGRERRQAIGYCNQCQICKPPRCHHCSVCQRCVLKMDHHCIWVVNCVGAQNYKFFLLFVLYTFLETMMNTLVLLPSFINFFQQSKHHSSSPGKLAITFLAFDRIP